MDKFDVNLCTYISVTPPPHEGEDRGYGAYHAYMVRRIEERSVQFIDLISGRSNSYNTGNLLLHSESVEFFEPANLFVINYHQLAHFFKDRESCHYGTHQTDTPVKDWKNKAFDLIDHGWWVQKLEIPEDVHDVYEAAEEIRKRDEEINGSGS